MKRSLSALFGLMLPALAAGDASLAADRALLIGLDQHADVRLNPKAGTPAGHDIEKIKGLLTSSLKFTPDNIKVISNAEATRDGILGAIEEWLIAGTKSGERAYIYFSGYGYFTKDASGDEPDGLDEGFVPHDAKVSFADGKLAIDGLVTDDDIAALVAKLVGRKVTLVADAGFSGRVVREGGGDAAIARVPDIQATTRAIVVEPKAQAQKAEGGYLDKIPAGVQFAAWSAVSASQTALLVGGEGGVFTKLYVEGIGEKKADANGNGIVSNAELLTYISDKSKAYCGEHKATCELGLTPRLEPLSAHAGGVVPGAEPGKQVVQIDPVISNGSAEPKPGDVKVVKKITSDTVTDFLSKGNPEGIQVAQIPSNVVHVGDKDIRFKVVSPHDGFLILLNLTDDGQLIQLFPNQFSRKRDTEGRVRAGAPLMVPDSYYGIRFNATEPSSGRIIAIVAKRKVDWDTAVGTRAIEVIPRVQAVEKVLPKIAAELGTPPASSNPETNTEPMEWSVASMRYEIKAK